jgi:ornithine cyclodeaminase/alanine dehydrogenase
MGLKVMTLARGVGNRYLLLVYVQASGELLAVLDADEITRLRTAATTAVAGELLCPAGTDHVGLVGTGFEAEGHLRAFAALWSLRQVQVYSRSPERRAAFAERMSAELGIAVTAVDSVDDVVGRAPVSLLCTKSVDPVVDGSRFAQGAVVLSIGSTRPDLRELDRATLRRSRAVLVDDAAQVMAESGDIGDGLASGMISDDRIVGMADWCGRDQFDGDGRDLLTFKSVGTALHDLAVASVAIEAAQRAGIGRDLGELSALKASAPGAVVPSSLSASAARASREGVST